MREKKDAILGCLIGCATGDALGLPYEGLSAKRAVRLLGEPDRHRFVFGRGMVSDDTEHTCMVAQALCRHPNDSTAFVQNLARRLRWWLLSCPAGIGFATLRACLKLWLGFSPLKSGVFSAGNGPAMRSAIFGAAFDDLAEMERMMEASTRLTHTDPKAQEGAFAVALAAWCARRGVVDREGYFSQHKKIAKVSEEFRERLDKVEQGLIQGLTIEEFAPQMGCAKKISGYVYHSVPMALFAWLRHPDDYRSAITGLIRCGGDADTTAAITGAILGAGLGREGIPQEWIAGLGDWMYPMAWLELLSVRLGESLHVASTNPQTQKMHGVPAPELFTPALLIRNAVFFVAVLGHVARRLLPPY